MIVGLGLIGTQCFIAQAEQRGTNGVARPLAAGERVRGWNILSDSEPDGLVVIAAAERYGINHLQLSHHIIHDLQHARDPRRAGVANRLAAAAHQAGIPEVTVWDRVFYRLDYYPERFRTGPGGTLDLDNPEFWEWFKADYREMLDLVPTVQGIILTFVETPGRVEQQSSRTLPTAAEKLAAAVDAVADVVIDERGLNLYIRTFAYTEEEYAALAGCIERMRHPGVRLMMKETPHDFFLTHPNDALVGRFGRPTIVEFDTGNEFHGQGIVANTWPEYVIERAGDLLSRPDVVGYVARTDRYGTTRAVGRPSEILLEALKRMDREPATEAETVYNEFIAARYGEDAALMLKPAFRLAREIALSTFYTLGTNMANHSKLNYDLYPSSYARHVSGRWIEPPETFVARGVNRRFHFWRDVVEQLAPPRHKRPRGQLLNEAPQVLRADWVTPEERITPEFLGYVVAEKDHGVALAERALVHVGAARQVMRPEDFADVWSTFERTLLTARLHRATAKAYFGFRVHARGGEFSTDALAATVRAGMAEIMEVATAIERYPEPVPAGQWTWREDAAMARFYVQRITDGWPEYGGHCILAAD